MMNIFLAIIAFPFDSRRFVYEGIRRRELLAIIAFSFDSRKFVYEGIRRREIRLP